MRLRCHPYTLEMRHAFNLASSSRTTTPVVLVEVEWEGWTGHGEASMPPYLGESHESVLAFLARVDLEAFADPFALEDILTAVDAIAPGNTAAKAAIDIALHDLVGQLLGQPWWRLWGLTRDKAPPTTFTLGIDAPDVMRAKTREAAGFRMLKLKMSEEHHLDLVDVVRDITDVPFTVDANGGWGDRGEALERIHALAARGCVLVEQPLDRSRRDDLAWLTERSPVPVIGDEGIRRVGDLRGAVGVYTGVNIKLMKCTGMREAMNMLTTARAFGLQVMVGCMTETSCAVSAAAQLSPLADFADLDGALLIRNDPFEGLEVVNGVVMPPERPGLGVRRRVL